MMMKITRRRRCDGRLWHERKWRIKSPPRTKLWRRRVRCLFECSMLRCGVAVRSLAYRSLARCWRSIEEIFEIPPCCLASCSHCHQDIGNLTLHPSERAPGELVFIVAYIIIMEKVLRTRKGRDGASKFYECKSRKLASHVIHVTLTDGAWAHRKYQQERKRMHL